MAKLEVYREAGRQLTICNACRYCEGYCPVFRAIEVRRDFQQGDVFYLANLCHDCRACYYACMYTPPHEFAINIPKILAEARMDAYRRWSWPAFLGTAFENSRITMYLAGVVAALVLAVGFIAIPSRVIFSAHRGAGAFYAVIPYVAMVGGALVFGAYATAVWLQGGARFWAETHGALKERGGSKPAMQALVAVLGLRYMKGGGPGCDYPDERPSGARRLYHSLTFWGFLLDLVSTTLAFVDQDFFHSLPPFPIASAPVVCGIAGGVGLLAGTGGLIWLKARSDPKPAATEAPGMDYAFLVVLGLIALTGMATVIFRASAAMGSLLLLHLALVAALFVTAPYGKFVHAVYRTLALLRYEVEQSRPGQGGSR